MSNHDLGDNFQNLSDADIEALHEIVQLASAKPGPAFGPGLFAAYDEVTARKDATGAESSRYFTFICRMLWGRKQNETVLERFSSLLGEHGITITPYDASTEDEAHEYEQEAIQPSFIDFAGGERQNGVLSSAETLAGDEEAPQPPRKSSFGTETRLSAAPQRPNGRKKRRSQSEDTHMRGIPGLDRGRMNARTASAQLLNRPRRTASVSSTRSLMISRSRANTLDNVGGYLADDSDSLDATQSRRHSVSEAASAAPFANPHDARSFLPPELLQRSDEQMDAIAETFQDMKGRIIQRRILSRWNHKTIQSAANHDQLLTRAENQDRDKLLRDSWFIWRQKLDTKRLDRGWEENENFYTTMEEAATKEREVNLKWIAFSHWKTMAKEEKQRTSIARRHILRRRYFTAWSNVTAVNDLKVRRCVLKKFFATWQQRLHDVQVQADQAIGTYEANLMKRTYQTWFFNFAERTAPEFQDRKLEKRYFILWRDAVRRILDNEREAEDTSYYNTQRTNLLSWKAKARDLLDMNALAENFRRHRLLSGCLDNWKREAVLAPRAAQLSLRVGVRIRTEGWNIWRKHAHMSRQAAHVQEHRLLRNAFTAWNDQMRVKFLASQIDIRIKAEAIYKWTIAMRSAEADREHDRRVTRDTLRLWLSKAQTMHRSIEGAEQTFATSQRRRTLQIALRKLVSASQQQQQLETDAQNFRQTRLLSGALAKWRRKNADVELLHRKANAAEFYLLSTKTLRNWSRSTEEHRKYRKREAYGHIRRQCKMNLAREMLRRMQIQLAHLRNMDRFALEFKDDRIVKGTVSTFTAWKDRAATCRQQERQAEEMYTRKLLSAGLRKMVQRKEHLQDMHTQARQLSFGSAAVEAMNCLRKLDRRLFQVKGQEQWALALRDKHWEKHVKNMVRYWHEQTIMARRQRGEEVSGEEAVEDILRVSTNTAPAIGDLTVFDNTAWNLEPLELNLDTFPGQIREEVDATFVDNEGIITSTPLPGYLRTPSKRNTARAKARERVAANARTTTSRTLRFADQVPATAPPRQQTSSAPPALPSPSGTSITPFERKLREQGFTSPSRFGRRTIGPGSGSSRFGASVGSGRALGSHTPATTGFAAFEDIPEVSEEHRRDI